LIKDAKDQAKNIILNANKLVENTIAEIKSSNADKEKTKSLRENLNVELNRNTVKVEPAKPNPAKVEEELKAGDWVKLIDSDTTGQVIEIIRENVVIAIGDLRTVAKKKKVEKVSKSSVPKEIRRTMNSHTSDFASFSPEIDVRGQRTEDALHNIEKLFDRALMMGFGNLKIIHGKGDGILRKMIRQYLKNIARWIGWKMSTQIGAAMGLLTFI
jgi:DNA mismatch repair protein MutS2